MNGLSEIYLIFNNSSMHFWAQDSQALSPDYVYTISMSPTGHETIV